MANGIDIRGAEQVLEQFELFDTPFFAVFQGKDLKFQHLEDNIDEARNLLRQNLEVLERNGSVAPFKIVYYYNLSANEKLVPENIKGSNTFRVISPGVSTNHPDYGNPERFNTNFFASKIGNAKIIDEQAAKIIELEERLNAMEAEAVEEQPQAVGGLNGIINGLLQNEQIQQAIIGRLLNFVDTILPNKSNAMNTANNASGASIAGIDETNALHDALSQLEAAGMTLNDFVKLATIAKEKQSYFQMLLQSLRTM